MTAMRLGLSAAAFTVRTETGATAERARIADIGKRSGRTKVRRQWLFVANNLMAGVNVERTPDFPWRPFSTASLKPMKNCGVVTGFARAAPLAAVGESCASPQAAFNLALSAWR